MKTVIYTIQGDQTERLQKQVGKFHPSIEFVVISKKDIKGSGDPQFMERATPSISTMLFKEFEQVVKIDSSVQVTGKLDELLNDEAEWDTTCITTFDPKNPPKEPVGVWDVHPLAYVDSRFVIMRNKNFSTDWLAMCHKPFFEHYKGRENDALNILIYYGDYRSKMIKINELKQVKL